jgi:hypothetical protein
MDGWSNSAAEGFCWAGFNGSPKIFDSLDPLIDILVTTSVGDDVGGLEWSYSSGILYFKGTRLQNVEICLNFRSHGQRFTRSHICLARGRCLYYDA